jgi:hypothetical protein
MIKFNNIDIQIKETHTQEQIQEIKILNQIEIAQMDIELTEDLKKEIRELERDNQYKYHYIYSYNLDTSMIDNVIHNDYSIYIGEGEKIRLFDEGRAFHKTKLYKDLNRSGAIITKKVEYIFRCEKNIDYDLGALAKSTERNLIESLSPIFNKDYNEIHKTTQKINNNGLYILLKNNKVIDTGVSVRNLEKDDIKKSSIQKLSKNTDLGVPSMPVNLRKEV